MNEHADSPTRRLAEGTGHQLSLSIASGFAITSALDHQPPGITFAALVPFNIP